MTSKVLPKSEQNFIRFVKVCLDVLKLPLVDILASEIQPADLYNEIQQHSCSLLNGKNKLDSNQRSICFLQPPAIPDYKQFDVTLLYKLIRNLCPSLEPTKGWGKDPVDADTQIGDDIERLRLFRNKHIHEGSSEISDNDFEIFWKNLKSVFQRIQSHMTAKGYKVNYEENLINIKQLDLGDELTDKYKVAYLIECEYERRKQAGDIEKPKISIKGPTSVLCGNNAKFSAYINPENLKGWSITWQKIVQLTHTRINSSTEKYSGSTDKILVIQSVCKGDAGGYQAILSRDSEAKSISVSSNVIVLHATGGPPIFEVWDVTTGMDWIKIHYGVKKRPPYVNEIKWIKDKVPIFNRNKKYEGGELNDCYFTITSPTTEDRGNYSCVIQNAVGSVQKDVKFDVPNVEISTEQEVYFGSKTSFTSRIVSCPSLDGVEWQQSNNGKTFKSIIISKPKYYGSSCDPKSPLLVIPKVKFEDKLYYRLLVWNKIGEQYSNTVFLDVKGSLPNITISHRTCVSNRSITLIGNVFLYGKFPAVKNVFWTKNGEELDTKGSGGRYSEVTIDNPSLAIFEVNEYDAGSYQLTATNALGSTTSDFLILDVPDVSLAKPEKKNSGFWFTVTIQSIPAPDFAQWSMKEKSSDTFIPIDENAEEFKGTSNTLPHPVLVVNPNIDLENYCFQIEVRNFIGSCKKITPGEGSSEDSFTNGNQGGLSKIYLDGGTGLKFAKLFDDIAELFPEKKTRRLKDFIQNSQNGKDITFFAQTVTARDCLEILRDHKMFTPWDVIFMQYLLKNTECKELFEKCVAYAEAHWALCFYEKVPENGFTNVQFHVRAHLSCYTPVEIRKIKETVADIVGCNLTEVFVNGYSHSSSFLAVLSIEKKHVKKLLTMNEQEKDKLSRLKIDFFIVYFIKVYLQSPQEIRGADDNGDYPIMLRKLWDRPTTLGSARFEKHSKELVPDTSDIVNAIQLASISVSVKEVKHISCLMPNRLWVSDMKKVQEIDKNGRILKELDINFTLFGSHTVTQSGDLLFLKDNDVFMLTSNGEVRNLSIHASVHFCIHSSRMNGDILIGDVNIVTRYNTLGIKLNEINLNDEGQSLYVETIFITENTNGDIIVSDNGNKAVVATDKSGRHLFNYKGHHSQTTFHPGGICTDDFGHILVCNVSSDQNVHLLDQKGQFLAYLLTKHQHGLDCPQALCVDSQHNLYVGYSNKNRINVYSYLAKEMIHAYYAKKSEAGVKLDSTEALYERSETNEREKDRLLEKFRDQISQRTKAQRDSDDESGISISSHQIKTDNATTQQTKGEVIYERSETNEREKDRLLEKYWDLISQITKAQRDSDDESGISISSHQTKTDNATTQQTKGVLYESSETNEREIDRLFEKYWNPGSQRKLKEIQPAKTQRDSDDESGISISSHQSKISISSHQTKTDNATTQQTKGVQFLEFVKWPCEFLPEVSNPDRKIAFREKVVFTVSVLLIFMVCCQMPLFGNNSSESVDPFYHKRVNWGSNRGTLMEFGIMPIIESNGILLALTRLRIIILDDTPYKHALLNGAQKLLALLLTVIMSVLFLMTGMYGELENIGVAILISIQLYFAGLILLLLNDIIKKGYCLCTDISLLIVPNICATIIWKALSPVTVYNDQGAEFEGAFVFLLQFLSTKEDNMFFLRRAFLRQNLPNLVNFLAIFFVFVAVIYLKGFHVELPMKSTIYKGQRSFYRINLLYTSAAPLILHSSFVSTFNLFSQVLSTKFKEHYFFNWLGVWADVRSDGPPHSCPIGGLSYYLSPPRTPLQVTQDPIYDVVYAVFMIGSCALFSRIWIDFINISAVDVATKLRDNKMVMVGHTEQSMLIELDRYIPTAAVLGGLCIGALSVLADFLGVFGSGTGVILVAIIIYEYAELFLKKSRM